MGFFVRFFLCGPFLKSLLNLLQHCFCFVFWLFGHEACGILTSLPGIEPALSVSQDGVLTLDFQGSHYTHITSTVE